MASIRKMRSKYYSRVVWRVNGKKKEILIPLKTASLTTARTRIKSVNNEERDIINGIIQKWQIPSIFRWLNTKGTSKFESLKLVDIIIDYFKYRECIVRKSTADRDVYAIKQLTQVLGENKVVQDITYKDIEQKFIPYYQNKGYQNGGINIALRTIRVFFSYLLKEKLIDEKISFKLLPIDDEPCYISRAEINALYEIVDERFRRWFYFYEMIGCRGREPYTGYLDQNIWKISPDEAKTKHWHYYPLTDELKYIWMELQDLKQSHIDNGKSEQQAINTCYQLIQKNMWRAVIKLKRSGVVPKEKKLTLKSFRHTFGIINVVKTKDIWGTSKKMNHKEIGVTQTYLDIDHYIIEQDFPELKPYLDLGDNNSNLKGEATPKPVKSSSPPMGSDLGDGGYELVDTKQWNDVKHRGDNN